MHAQPTAREFNFRQIVKKNIEENIFGDIINNVCLLF